MMKSILKKVLLTTAIVTTAMLSLASFAQAKDTLVWWDLGGGDGVRMRR